MWLQVQIFCRAVPMRVLGYGCVRYYDRVLGALPAPLWRLFSQYCTFYWLFRGRAGRVRPPRLPLLTLGYPPV